MLLERSIRQAKVRNINQNVAVIQDDDVVGTGRYILSFFLAGLVGLAIQYGLRNKGWTATWINAVLFAVVVTMVVATG